MKKKYKKNVILEFSVFESALVIEIDNTYKTNKNWALMEAYPMTLNSDKAASLENIFGIFYYDKNKIRDIGLPTEFPSIFYEYV